MNKIPNGDPPAAMRHASPPVEPPGVRSLSHGFLVSPQMGLLHPKLHNNYAQKEIYINHFCENL